MTKLYFVEVPTSLLGRPALQVPKNPEFIAWLEQVEHDDNSLFVSMGPNLCPGCFFRKCE